MKLPYYLGGIVIGYGLFKKVIELSRSIYLNMGGWS
jgi:hypothetical protein